MWVQARRRPAVAPRPRGGGETAAPLQALQHLTREAHGVGVVFGHVLAQARDGGMHFGATEFLFSSYFTGGGLEQRRAGQERARDHAP